MFLDRENGWTGGQYSIFRVFFGAYLLWHFAALLPWGAEVFSSSGVLPDAGLSPLIFAFPNLLALNDSPATAMLLIGAACVASVLFMVGKFDRTSAVVCWYALACLFGRNPLIANPSLPFVGWMLLAHACFPPAPFGSCAARGRVDPRGGWHYPGAIYAAIWIVMALAYSYSGYTKLVSPSWVDGSALERVLNNPLARPGLVRDLMLAMPSWLLAAKTWGALGLELLYAPLALFRVLRPWIWLAMLGMHLGLMLTVDFADLSMGMVMLHLFTFNPAWIPARQAAGASQETVFYDGRCGLCHGSVRFVLAEDRAAVFRFSPLQGEAFAQIGEPRRKELPDSVVVQTAAGELVSRSTAVIYVAERLGGGWRVLGLALRLVPKSLRDWVYDGIARVRLQVFGTKTDACPLLPLELRERFIW